VSLWNSIMLIAIILITGFIYWSWYYLWQRVTVSGRVALIGIAIGVVAFCEIVIKNWI